MRGSARGMRLRGEARPDCGSGRPKSEAGGSRWQGAPRVSGRGQVSAGLPDDAGAEGKLGAQSLLQRRLARRPGPRPSRSVAARSTCRTIQTWCEPCPQADCVRLRPARQHRMRARRLLGPVPRCGCPRPALGRDSSGGRVAPVLRSELGNAGARRADSRWLGRCNPEREDGGEPRLRALLAASSWQRRSLTAKKGRIGGPGLCHH